MDHKGFFSITFGKDCIGSNSNQAKVDGRYIMKGKIKLQPGVGEEILAFRLEINLKKFE